MDHTMKTGKDASGKLFDNIIKRFDLKNDSALCKRMNVAPPQISKIRNGYYDVSPSMLIHIHENLGYTFPEMRALLPKPSKKG